MSYKTYITDALVCAAKDRNTSDKSYLLFTRDAGMLWANAKSVREEKSKNRYALQDFSLIRATLISGKAGWKITSVEPVHNFYFSAKNRRSRGAARNILRQLRRLLHGETPHPELFDDLVVSFREDVDAPELLEVVMTLRLLSALGYVAPERTLKAVLSHQYSYQALSALTKPQLSACECSITHALHASQL